MHLKLGFVVVVVFPSLLFFSSILLKGLLTWS